MAERVTTWLCALWLKRLCGRVHMIEASGCFFFSGSGPHQAASPHRHLRRHSSSELPARLRLPLPAARQPAQALAEHLCSRRVSKEGP